MDIVILVASPVLAGLSLSSGSNKTQGWSRTVIDVGVACKEKVDDVISFDQEGIEIPSPQ